MSDSGARARAWWEHTLRRSMEPGQRLTLSEVIAEEFALALDAMEAAVWEEAAKDTVAHKHHVHLGGAECTSVLEFLFRARAAARSPGHTDLMISPEAIAEITQDDDSARAPEDAQGGGEKG